MNKKQMKEEKKIEKVDTKEEAKGDYK